MICRSNPSMWITISVAVHVVFIGIPPALFARRAIRGSPFREPAALRSGVESAAAGALLSWGRRRAG
jgi:hypothetical protein